MAVTEAGVLSGLIILTVIGILLIIVISAINLASGLQTLAFFVALWSFFFGIVYAGLFAYNCTINGTGDDTESTDRAAPGSDVPATAMKPLDDDLLQALDDQLRAQEEGLDQPFQGDD